MKNKELREKIILGIMNEERLKRMPIDIPHVKVLDLAIYCKALDVKDDYDIASLVITNDIMKKLELSEEELLALAKENTLKRFPPEIEFYEETFYVLTNKFRFNGAVNAFVTKEIEKLNKSLYVLPSSIHEVLILPNQNQDVNYLKSIVYGANRSVVSTADVLSDSVYYFDQSDKEIKILK